MTSRPWHPGVPRWAGIVAAAALALIALPFLALALRADWSELLPAAGSAEALAALGLSVRTALAATVISLLLGLPMALVLARWRSRWAAVLRAIVLLPLVAPPLVGGMALLALLGRAGPVGQLLGGAGVTVPFTTAAVVIAQAFVAMPFLIVSAEGALRACDPRFESAAALLGAGPGRVALTITIPLIAPGVASGTLLCFARALGEFGATALFAGNIPGVSRTMPLAIYTAFNSAGGQAGTAIVLSLELLAVAAVILLASGLWRSGAPRRDDGAARPARAVADASRARSTPSRLAADGDRLEARVTVSRGGFELTGELSVEAGQVVAVIGPNGSGKSTLLAALAGLAPLDSGRVALGGRDLSGPRGSVPLARRQVGLLGQEPALFPHLTARQNVAYGPRSGGEGRGEADARAAALLAQFDAERFAAMRPGALSGGERQRVALARIFAPGPRLVLLDEAFAALDVEAAPRLRSAVREALRELAAPCLIVTHDVLDVLGLADRVVVLEGGRIADDGPTSRVLFEPRAPFAAQLAGLNLVSGSWRDGRFWVGDWSFECTGPGDLAAIPYAGLRLAPPGADGQAEVSSITAGDGVARVRLAGTVPLTVEVPLVDALRVAPGDLVGVTVTPAAVRCYPAAIETMSAV